MTTRTRYVAEYSYPGSFFAETTTRELPDATYESAVAVMDDDHWYAVTIREITERKYTASNGSYRWLADGELKTSWVIGRQVHWQDIPDTPENAILRSNIRSNSTDGYGVQTRRGNWQMASDYDHVVSA